MREDIAAGVVDSVANKCSAACAGKRNLETE